MYKYGIIFGVIILVTTQFAYAESTSLNIYTEKEVYHYGDYLTITIEVDEVTGELAILHITDEFGKSGSAIPILIEKENTTIKFPFPFDNEVFIESEYTLDIQYAGEQSSTKFNLIDSGKITIPYWHKDAGRLWSNGGTTDDNFIKYLIDNKIISGSNLEITIDDKPKIPEWFKKVTSWWVDGLIHDEDFVNGLNNLIKRGIITG